MQNFQNSFFRFWIIFIFKLSISKHKNWGLLPLVGYKNGSNIVRSSWNFNTKKYRYSWVHPQNFSFLTRWFLVKMGFIIRLVWKLMKVWKLTIKHISRYSIILKIWEFNCGYLRKSLLKCQLSSSIVDQLYGPFHTDRTVIHERTVQCVSLYMIHKYRYASVCWE